MLGEIWRRDGHVRQDEGDMAEVARADAGGRRFAAEAAHAFAAPIALVKLCCGGTLLVCGSIGTSMRRLERRHSFCAQTLKRGTVTEVADAASDPQFSTLALVTAAPFIRYYIGAPMRTPDGIDIGAVCVMDTMSRPAASADQRRYLAVLARQAAFAMEPQAAQLGRRAW